MANADDLSIVRPFLPSKPPGHIVLTTRWQSDDKFAKPLAIEAMKPEEGLRFLLRRTGRLQKKDEPDKEAELDAVAEDIRKSALQLAEILGGHPLALEQAGAYVKESHTSFADYLELYEKHRLILLDQHGALGGVNSEHPLTVAATFRTSLAKARELCTMAEDILYFCVFLQPDAIPEELFKHDDCFKADAMAFGKGIAALCCYSLVNYDTQDKTLSLHRLVQAVVIEEMPRELQKQWRERVVRVLNAVFPEVHLDNERQFARFFLLAMSCLIWTDDELAPIVGAAESLLNICIKLGHISFYEESSVCNASVINQDTATGS